MVAFEAAVAGGIPIIKALREGLTANRIEWIAGIINGTTNFILSRDARQGAGLRHRAEGGAAAGLCRGRPDLRHRGHRRRAQGDHHVRASPSASRCSSTRRTSRASPRCRPPTSATPSSWATASSCSASRRRTPQGIELRVHPTLMPAKRLIANVEGAMNAVVVQGDAVGTTLYYGKGAGCGAHRVGRGRRPGRHHPAAHRRPRPPRAAPGVPARRAGQTRRSCRWSEVVTAYYLRLHVADQTGVLARITSHPGRARHLDRRGAAARVGRRRAPDRPDHPDARHA